MVDDRNQRFNDLYRRYAPAVFRRASTLLGGDAAAAQDIMQDVFLAFFKNEGQWRGEASPFTVLYQMATYQSVDRLRHRARWHGALKALPAEEDELDGVALLPVADSALRRVDAMHDLALLTKGEDERTLTCAVLYFVEGYTTEEIAQSLDLSRKTVGRALAAFAERANKRAERFAVKGST